MILHLHKYPTCLKFQVGYTLTYRDTILTSITLRLHFPYKFSVDSYRQISTMVLTIVLSTECISVDT